MPVRPLFLLALCAACSGSGSDDSTAAATGTPSAGPGFFVTLDTPEGAIELELFPDEAPNTVDNFLAYVEQGFFDGTDGDGAGTFYRAVPGFVLQGGGVRVDGTQKDAMAPIANEASSSGLSNLRRTIAMARTNDPDSATAEFFINLDDNTFLDPGESTPDGYAVFGRVVDGMGVVNTIVSGPTNGEYLLDPIPFDGASRHP